MSLEKSTVTRRDLIRGVGVLLCAPAIVRVSSLMPLKVVEPNNVWHLDYEINFDRFVAIGRPAGTVLRPGTMLPDKRLLKDLNRWINKDIPPGRFTYVELPPFDRWPHYGGRVGFNNET